MNTTQLVPLAMGTLISYTYRSAGMDVTVVGRKGEAINPGYNGGFKILSESGEVIANISRHAWVEVI